TIKKLARLYMQHQFLPDVVFLATPDTPARMLTVVEEMVEVLAKAMPKNGEPGTVDSPKQPPRPVGRTGVRSASA
ncbi:MAG: hypothetical protein ABIY70_17540, partial [Capsulimonas sp.]|uniref:hypothetical protein n=1 Tax=Capsulimonas sp. TaxID=2494211 RepID=UPI0032638989